MVSPYQDDSEAHFRQAYYARKTSALAVLSLISGLASFPMMCCLVASIPFSVFAIVCGHLSRGIIRQSRGEYSGAEMATFGLLMGYLTLLIMGGVLLYGIRRVDPIVDQGRTRETVENSAGEVLLRQAEDLLLNDVMVAAGSSTTQADARALARHVVDTLEVFDRTHLEATGRSPSTTAETKSAEPERTSYRAFAQVNPDSAAVLIYVSNLDQFTDEARGLLQERCWLIVQRSVDDLLPEKADLAVAIYSPIGRHAVLMGKAQRSGDAAAGLESEAATQKQLAAFFRLAERNHTDRPNSSQSSQRPPKPSIDARPLPDGLPAEVE